MLMVVTNHVFGMGFGVNTKYSTFMSLCLLFRMPLFFFISGFLAYKASFSWGLGDTGRLLAKKIRVQIVPTLVFMTAFVALTCKHFWADLTTAWQSPTKDGYWFTLVLLEMFVAYYAVCFLARRCCRHLEYPHRAESVVLAAVWFVALVGYATMYMPSWFSWQKDELWQVTSLTEFVRYFHFFLFGNLVRRHWQRVQRALDAPWLFPVLVAVAFVCAAEYLQWHNLRRQWANLPRTLAMYSLVTMTVACFRNYASTFSNEHVVGRALQYVGVRTLDVYLLHYFFLPHLPSVGKWLRTEKIGFALEGTTCITLALVVTAFALLASNILRVSPFLKKWLFGRE